MVCTKRFQEAAFFHRTGRRDDNCTLQLGDLQCGKADTASCAMDEDGFTGFDMAELDHGVIGGEECHRNRCGSLKIEAGRELRHAVTANLDVRGEGRRANAHDTVTGDEIRHRRTDRDDAAGHFHADGCAGKAVFERFFRKQAHGPHDVTEVEAGRFHGENDLVGIRHRLGSAFPDDAVDASIHGLPDRGCSEIGAFCILRPERTARCADFRQRTIAQDPLTVGTGGCKDLADIQAEFRTVRLEIEKVRGDRIVFVLKNAGEGPETGVDVISRLTGKRRAAGCDDHETGLVARREAGAMAGERFNDTLQVFETCQSDIGGFAITQTFGEEDGLHGFAIESGKRLRNRSLVRIRAEQDDGVAVTKRCSTGNIFSEDERRRDRRQCLQLVGRGRGGACNDQQPFGHIFLFDKRGGKAETCQKVGYLFGCRETPDREFRRLTCGKPVIRQAEGKVVER